MNEGLKIVNTLKYLPIRVKREYFQSLPQPVLDQFYEYLVGQHVFTNNPEADKALRIFIYFLSFHKEGTGHRAAKKELTSYILNYE